MKKRLTPIVSNTRKFAVFDIETYKWVNPYALGFYDGKDYFEFLGKRCIREFLTFILRHKYRGLTIYAHNGGRFDFNFIMEILKDMPYKFEMIFQGSRCLMIKIYQREYIDRNGKRHSDVIKLCDSVGLLRFRLDDLTKDFDVLHKKLNFMDKQENERDYEYLYRLYKENDERFHDYLMHDVLGLHEVLTKFDNLLKNNNGLLGLTIASTSMKTFQKGYLKKDLIMSDRTLNDEMKLAYYGGRTEIFRMYLPEDKYRCYDINSLYPYVMFNNSFPIGKPKIVKNVDKKTIQEYMGITECKVITPKELYLPVLPFKMKMGNHNKLIFPLGKMEGYWDNHQLRKAIELGYKVIPKKGFIFESDYLFKDYVKNFYELKKNSKSGTPSYILAKLLLNALYGKFAQGQDSEMIMKFSTPEEMKEHDIVGVVDNDRGLYKVKKESDGNFFIPQISIHVTALAQLRLYHFMESLINKGYVVSYCDTDSLFTNGHLPTSDRLGDMKKEYGFYEGYFLLPKTYGIIKDDGKIKIKAKGFKSKFQDELTIDDFKRAIFKKDLSGFQIESQEQTFNTMKTSFVRHGRFVSVDIPKKSIRATYDKRIILKDYDTRPLII